MKARSQYEIRLLEVVSFVAQCHADKTYRRLPVMGGSTEQALVKISDRGRAQAVGPDNAQRRVFCPQLPPATDVDTPLLGRKWARVIPQRIAGNLVMVDQSEAQGRPALSSAVNASSSNINVCQVDHVVRLVTHAFYP